MQTPGLQAWTAAVCMAVTSQPALCRQLAAKLFSARSRCSLAVALHEANIQEAF